MRHQQVPSGALACAARRLGIADHPLCRKGLHRYLSAHETQGAWKSSLRTRLDSATRFILAWSAHHASSIRAMQALQTGAHMPVTRAQCRAICALRTTSDFRA